MDLCAKTPDPFRQIKCNRCKPGHLRLCPVAGEWLCFGRGGRIGKGCGNKLQCESEYVVRILGAGVGIDSLGKIEQFWKDQIEPVYTGNTYRVFDIGHHQNSIPKVCFACQEALGMTHGIALRAQSAFIAELTANPNLAQPNLDAVRHLAVWPFKVKPLFDSLPRAGDNQATFGEYLGDGGAFAGVMLQLGRLDLAISVVDAMLDDPRIRYFSPDLLARLELLRTLAVENDNRVITRPRE